MRWKPSLLIAFALWFAPREFREGYRLDFPEAAASRLSPLREAVDVLWAGVAMRFESLARDVTFAVRSLGKARLFTAVALLTLALAISVNAAVFGVVNSILFKPLPFVQPQQLAFLCPGSPSQTWCGQMSNGVIGALREHSHTIEGIADFQYQSYTLTGYGVPRSLDAGSVSANFFQVMAVRPELGQFFTSRDAKAGQRAVVISHRLWQDVFGGGSRVIGQSLVLDGQAHRIIGVVPQGFALPTPFGNGTPGEQQYDVFSAQPETSFHTLLGLNDTAFVRTKPGVSSAQLQNDIDSAVAASVRANPTALKGLQVTVRPFGAWFHRNARTFLYLAMAAVFAVLLIACANVANLLLVRGAARQGELAVRDALGAGRRRILQQLFTEIGLLVLAGGVLGIACAWFELRGLIAINPSTLVPGIQQAHLDGHVIAFTFVLMIVATLAGGCVPAMLATRTGAARALKSAGRGGDGSGAKHFRAVLVIAEIALAFAVVIASGLLYRSFDALAHGSNGVDARNIYVAVTSLYAPRWERPESRSAFVDEAIARIRALPGVESASAVRPSFAGGNGPEQGQFRLPGHRYAAGSEPSAIITQMTPGYLQSLRVPLLAGRRLNVRDTGSSARVAVVDAHFAAMYLSGKNPVGSMVLLPTGVKGTYLPTKIVGVTANITPSGELDNPRVFVPNAQYPTYLPELFIKMSVPDPHLQAHVAAAVARADSRQAVQQMYSLSDRITSWSSPEKSGAALVGVLAAVALLLALAGIYAVVSYSVEQRRHEFGVRMAIGAARSDVFRSVLSRSLGLGAMGVILGIVFAALGVRFLSGLLFTVSPFDLPTFGFAAALLLLSVILASLVPAVRAARLHPSVALRYE